MTVKELRTSHGMNIKEFSDYFNIPYRTVQNWDAGVRECPEYLLELMKYKLNNESKGVETMTKERQIEILMMDRCTNSEAERHLKRGATIFTDFEEYFEEYMKEWGMDEEQIEEYREMVEKKSPVEDWGVVEDNGKTYYIQYVN